MAAPIEKDLDPARAMGDPGALDMLTSLVATAPTNLEDPAHRRYEKPNYLRATERIARAARKFGLATRIYDPLTDGPPQPHLAGIPRPNVIIDLETGAAQRLLILAHYDVVPVPAEQLDRWKSPPHVLTRRADGRLYGRGSNDDLGSGVVASLIALKRLADAGNVPRNVRLVVCCDEETGGEGGVESLKAHDDALPAGDPGRFLLGDVALIPDGSPHATAASSGLAFLDATSNGRIPWSSALTLGRELEQLHAMARGWTSTYRSPDWPDHLAPEAVLTGRATVTKWDLAANPSASDRARLIAVRAETDAANQIAEAVTLVFHGPKAGLDAIAGELAQVVAPPFRVAPARSTSLEIPDGALALQIVGESAHGGYPHRGHNPVPEALRVLALPLGSRWTGRSDLVDTSFAVDLRLVPEMELKDGRQPALDRVRAALARAGVDARVDAPDERCRRGYALAVDHPELLRLERILRSEGGEAGVFGEYGGTDASTLAEVRTPAGGPLPAIVFGSMDRAAHIHEAEESVDPRLIGTVARTIERFVRET